MRRNTAVHFEQSDDGDVLVDESGSKLQLPSAGLPANDLVSTNNKHAAVEADGVVSLTYEEADIWAMEGGQLPFPITFEDDLINIPEGIYLVQVAALGEQPFSIKIDVNQINYGGVFNSNLMVAGAYAGSHTLNGMMIITSGGDSITVDVASVEAQDVYVALGILRLSTSIAEG